MFLNKIKYDEESMKRKKIPTNSPLCAHKKKFREEIERKSKKGRNVS